MKSNKADGTRKTYEIKALESKNLMEKNRRFKADVGQ
jgi:hypothetical protein